MKRLFPSGIIFFAFLTSASAWANPFRGPYVCVPELVPNHQNLEFKIRDGGQCAKGDRWMKVVTERDGTVLLYPSDTPLSPEDEKDLKEFKKFYGVDR